MSKALRGCRMETVDDRELLATATAQFNLALQFFPRADAKMSTLFGYYLGMLAFLGANAPAPSSWPLMLWIPYSLAILAIGASLVSSTRLVSDHSYERTVYNFL